MEKVGILEAPDLHRRRFLGAAAVALAAAELGVIRSARAQAGAPNQPAASAGASFGPLKQIDAGDLNVGYVDAGPADGPAVILLHGWPYDIHSFVDVAPLLTSAGYRVIVPHLRGYGTTRFLSSETPRNGEQAAIGVDTIALHGCAQDPEGDPGAALIGERARPTLLRRSGPSVAAASSRSAAILSAARKRARSRCRRAPSCNGGTNTISPPTAAEPATSNTCASLRS